MAAIAYGQVAGWGGADRLEGRRPPTTRPLRLVDAGTSRRPSSAVLRRRRLVALALLVMVALAAVRVVDARVGASGQAGSAAHVPVVLVARTGDSYWSLAARLNVGGDLRSTVDALVRANGGHDLHAGDRLQLAP